MGIFRDGRFMEHDVLRRDTLDFNAEKGRFNGGSYHTICGSVWSDLLHVQYTSQKELVKPDVITISGKIKGWNQQNVKLYIWKKYPDHEFFNHENLPVNADGTFHWQLPLTRPVEATLRIGNPDEEGSYSKQLFLEPGDQLDLEIGDAEDKEWRVTGPQAVRFELENELNNATKVFSTHHFATPEEFDRAMEKLQKRFVDKIEEATVSIWARKHLKSILYVYCYNKASREFDQHFSESKGIEVWKAKWLNPESILKYFSYPTFDARDFLRRFVDTRIKEFRQGANYSNEKPSSEDKFYLTKNLLNLEARYYTLAFQIADLIKKGAIASAEKLFKDFAALYPKTESTEYFKQYLGDATKIMVGKEVPGFTVEDQGGRSISFESLKGKWVHLFFASMEEDYDLPVIESLGKIAGYVDDSRFMPVVVLTDVDVTAQKLEKIRKVYAGKLLFNPGWKYSSTLPFNVSYQRSAFLINPDGQFESTWDQSISISLYDKKDSQVKAYAQILKRYFDLKEEQFSRTEVYKSRLYWTLNGIVIAGLLVWFFFYRRNKKLKKEEAQKREKIHLELKAIRSQLNPHFMFNTLNSIQHLVMDERTDDATHYISEFSGLMRQVLQHSNKELVPLEEVIKSVETYLELEALRFGFKYTVEVDAGLDVYNIEIPGLLLQPFVENAVIHGISAIREKGCIRVRYAREGDQLLCSVDDNGGGYYPVKNKMVNGQGIALSERRLQMMSASYAGQVDLKILNKVEHHPDEKGTLVQISFELDHD
ncbi:MAG: histidine kinase [Marinilabiliaceae bacterium]|nr:histidine kinase [Marinilabiliaceae bacterium]